MSSLADKIASLTNPVPKVQDPEDDVNIETVPKIDDSCDEVTEYTVSELRSKTAPLLEDIDPAYAGKKVSRKSLDDIFLNDANTSATVKDDEDSFYDQTESSGDEASDDDLDDVEDLKNFITSVKNQENMSGGDDEEEDKNSADEEESDEESSEDEVESSEDIINKLSNIDVTSEIEKGAAVKAQQELFNRLCECRIKLQRLLIISNRLPQSNCWKIVKKKGGKDLCDIMQRGSNSVKALLNTCFNFYDELLKLDAETSNLELASCETEYENNEEIPSDTDEEISQKEYDFSQKNEKRDLKRKLKCEEYEDILAKRHKSLIPYRNSVIQKWDEKTKLSSGRITQKSFSAFESSAVKQIDQILQDEHRLIKRTQLKRSLYRVLGKPDVPETGPEETAQSDKPVPKQDMLLRDYDPEIYDDDDFYRQLLKDIIENKSVGIDPAVLRKQMEIQSVRNRIKKKVDTKASKGRKIRYDVHPKLVNFMAPVETSTISDEARENLLKCLFGTILINKS